VTDSDVLINGALAEPSSSLLARVRACDQAAWERLVNLYSPLVYRWCRQSGLQAADAADVGQQVFLAVARKIGDFRRDRDGDSFRGWLRTIAMNRLCDHQRTLGKNRAEGGDALDGLAQLAAADSGASDTKSQREEEESLLFRRAMDLMRTEFEEKTWQAFWQVVVDGRSPADVGRDLGMTANAVYLARGRVLRRLREEFADLIDLDPPRPRPDDDSATRSEKAP
jgi:RNA polymerase sigma-70 factor (ECF subfamily)